MVRLPLDPHTADLLVEGRLGAGEIPAELREVLSLLDAARSTTTQRDLSRLDTTVAAMTAAVVTAEPTEIDALRPRSPYRSLRTKLAAGSVAGLVTLFGGLAAAGALPGPVQNAVHDVTDVVPKHGHGHGRGHEKQAVNPAGPQQSDDQGDEPVVTPAGAPTTTVVAPPCPAGTDNHGEYVSGVATSVPPGSEHGKTVSAGARSDCGKPATEPENPAQRDEQGPKAPDDHGKPPVTQPENHGNEGGTPGNQGDSANHGANAQSHGDDSSSPGSSGEHGSSHS
jgi:hypothetical protein